MGRSDPRAALNFGITTGVVGIVLLIIGIIIILLAWRKKKSI
jgi:hypothetical protein